MIKVTRQFTAPTDEFLAITAEELDWYCSTEMPNFQFRFVTFENNDFRKKWVVCRLYDYVPDSVFFSVKTPLDIESALDMLIVLNPRVEWYFFRLHYSDNEPSSQAQIMVELRLTAIPMRVGNGGVLICK